jgi:hypothetical protein
MIRLRIALVAAVTSLAFGALVVPAMAASKASDSSGGSAYNFRALYSVPVTGATKSGKQFKGSFGIQRFVVSHNKAYAVGTLTGKLGNQHVSKTGVRLPASLTGAPGGTSSSSARAAQTTSCSILNLVLGPVHVNLLGLVVDLGGNGGTTPITLNITAVPGAGNLLGNLLCDVSNLLNQSGTLSTLQGDVSQLVGVLNGILGDLSATGV